MLPKLDGNFILQELVHPKLYKSRGVNALSYVDPAVISVAQHLRHRFGPITINNWHTGGRYKDSGVRLTYGSRTSAHMFGKALDLKFGNATVKEVYDYILANQTVMYALGLRRMEHISCTPTWLHIDTLETTSTEKVNTIYVFKV